MCKQKKEQKISVFKKILLPIKSYISLNYTIFADKLVY